MIAIPVPSFLRERAALPLRVAEEVALRCPAVLELVVSVPAMAWQEMLALVCDSVVGASPAILAVEAPHIVVTLLANSARALSGALVVIAAQVRLAVAHLARVVVARVLATQLALAQMLVAQLVVVVARVRASIAVVDADPVRSGRPFFFRLLRPTHPLRVSLCTGLYL